MSPAKWCVDSEQPCRRVVCAVIQKHFRTSKGAGHSGLGSRSSSTSVPERSPTLMGYELREIAHGDIFIARISIFLRTIVGKIVGFLSAGLSAPMRRSSGSKITNFSCPVAITPVQIHPSTCARFRRGTCIRATTAPSVVHEISTSRGPPASGDVLRGG